MTFVPVDFSDDFPGEVLLHTRRLTLRGLRYSDINIVCELNASADTTKWLLEPAPSKLAPISNMIARVNALYKTRPGIGIWYAHDRERRFVGLFSLMPVDGSDDLEIGARLHPSTWGRMYSVEGSRAVCAHAFATLRLPRVIGFCDPANASVPAIFRRLGFQRDGETTHFDKLALRYVLSRDAWLTQARRHGSGEASAAHEPTQSPMHCEAT